MGDFLMPSLGADMEVGTILEWRVQPGDVVHRGDIVAVVDTEKSDIDVEVFEEGTIEELLVEVGREVPVGTPLARIGPAATPSPTTDGADARPVAPRGPAPSHVRATPLARRRAAEQGVDLGARRGSGPGGAIRAGDLDSSAPAPAPTAPAPEPVPPTPAPAPATEEPPRRAASSRRTAMRTATAALMARSKRQIPHYYLATTVDLAAARDWLAQHNERLPVTERVLPGALLLKATARAAREVPALNGFWEKGLRLASSVNLGVAVSLRDGGLIAPAIPDADLLSTDELMAALRDVVDRARAGRLRSSDMAEPTITVTNLGDQGADEVFGVIYPPQIALVGFGRVVERPWAVDGMLTVRPVVRATLAADHRATTGHEGSRFLETIDHLLQAPEDL